MISNYCHDFEFFPGGGGGSVLMFFLRGEG